MSDSTTPAFSVEEWRYVILPADSARTVALQILSGLSAYANGAPARDIETLANALHALMGDVLELDG